MMKTLEIKERIRLEVCGKPWTKIGKKNKKRLTETQVI